jgi:predicted phage terminase large subunit-like protein
VTLQPTSEAFRLELAERRLKHFVRQAWHVLEPATPLKWGWALDAICEHLEAITNGELNREGEGPRLIITVPPGSMKSLLVNVFWPAWEWGPRGLAHMRYVSTAHKESLAIRDNAKCRRLVKSDWYQARWPIELRGDQDAKGKFENTASGFRAAMAFNSLTGDRGGRVLVDDPHSVDDANSPLVLAGDIVTFREAIPSRVEDEKSAIVIVMQRLNEADVAAVAVELGYDHLCIPMRFEADRKIPPTKIGWTDPRKVDGELMFPERFPEAQVTSLEKSLGSYASAGQLQQRPSPRGGGMFKKQWLSVVPAAPANLREVRAWDFAASVAKPGRDPDWTVGLRMGKDPAGFFYIMDVIRFRESPAAVERSMLSAAQQDGKRVHIKIPQDPGQAGVGQASAFTRLLAGYVVRVVRPTGSKETRAAPFAAQCEAGNVKLVAGDWNAAFLDEISVFPAGRHDDQVDAASDAFADLAEGSKGSRWLATLDAYLAMKALEAEQETTPQQDGAFG